MKYFGKFADKYGIEKFFYGFYFLFDKRRMLGLYCSLIKSVYDAEAGQPQLDLLQFLQDKNYFEVTTN
ncbi:hypothetical protein AM232_12665 [Bacillus sp. FJAT-21352]|nr:hypothetical protein AM232_12665 [Bacillus sp. FJAT-21352]